MSTPLLSIRGLTVTFPTRAGPSAMVDGLDLDIFPGRCWALSAKAAAGKSLTALSILRLVAKPGKITQGSILFEGVDLLQKTEADMHGLRGSAISMIFQEPMSSLNPVFSIGDQIAEPLRQHRGLDQAGGAQGRPRSLADGGDSRGSPPHR